MAEGFFKFPRTPHLLVAHGANVRGDKVLERKEADALLRRLVSVEEKVDGANLGLSLGPDGRLRAQSRGHYLEHGTGGQFQPLWRWLAARESALRAGLRPKLIAFGEWCYARHSVSYDQLPDWFLLFDVYDQAAERFWSRVRREAWAARVGLAQVPLIGQGTYTRTSVEKLLGPSRVGSTAAEGVYLRWDEDEWLAARAKVVRPGWVAADDEHWSRRPLQTNRLLEAEMARKA